MSTGVPVKARTLVWGDPGCAFAKNTDDEYKRKKDKWLHDYCCQACQKSSGKSHGVACQKVVRGKSQAKSSWEPDASSWKAGWKHSEEKEGEESSGSTWRKAASNSAPAAGEAVNDRGPRGKAAKESTFDPPPPASGRAGTACWNHSAYSCKSQKSSDSKASPGQPSAADPSLKNLARVLLIVFARRFVDFRNPSHHRRGG